MADPASTHKIEKMRFQLKADPKARIFFPLAEELRKVGQLAEAEQVLRTGLAVHPTYLSAWVSLGRVLRDLQKHGDAVEPLKKALQLDPGNVVAARLLGDVYLGLGEKVEAIKKYKLVHALLPGDEDVEATIQRLDAEINTPLPIPEPAQLAAPAPEADESPFAPEPIPAGEETSPFGQSSPLFEQPPRSLEAEGRDVATGDVEPMRAAHEQSPFEEPAIEAGYGSHAFAIEEPSGVQTVEPLPAELPEPIFVPLPPPPSPAPVVDDFTKTITMADLYASQGLIDEARDIYEDVLTRDPSNDVVRAKLEALTQPSPAPAEPAYPLPQAGEGKSSAKVDKLQRWLTKVKGREVGGV
jgi:tetratricopeptide (TPR) repeat protein